MPQKFRKKPVVIEAMRIDPQPTGYEIDPNRLSIAKVSGWLLSHGFRRFRAVGGSPFGIAIETLEGVMTAQPGDWVIRGVKGEFYPCRDDIFRATYEPVEGEG